MLFPNRRGDHRAKEKALQVGTGPFGLGILGSWVSESNAPCLLDLVLTAQDPESSPYPAPRAYAGFCPRSVLPMEDHTTGVCIPRPEESAKRCDCVEGGQSLDMCARVSALFPQSPF